MSRQPGAGDQRVEPAMGAPVGKAPGPVGQLEVGLDQRREGQRLGVVALGGAQRVAMAVDPGDGHAVAEAQRQPF